MNASPASPGPAGPRRPGRASLCAAAAAAEARGGAGRSSSPWPAPSRTCGPVQPQTDALRGDVDDRAPPSGVTASRSPVLQVRPGGRRGWSMTSHSSGPSQTARPRAGGRPGVGRGRSAPRSPATASAAGPVGGHPHVDHRDERLDRDEHRRCAPPQVGRGRPERGCAAGQLNRHGGLLRGRRAPDPVTSTGPGCRAPGRARCSPMRARPPLTRASAKGRSRSALR